MSRRGLLFTSARITPAMFESALQLCRGIRAEGRGPGERCGQAEFAPHRIAQDERGKRRHESEPGGPNR